MVDMKAYFAFGSFILSINSSIVCSVTVRGSNAMLMNALQTLSCVGYNDAKIYSSNVLVDDFMVPAGETKISLSTMLEFLIANSAATRSEEHTSELQSLAYLVCRLLLEKKNKIK